GAGGLLVRWQVAGPLAPDAAAPLLIEPSATNGTPPDPPVQSASTWPIRFASGFESRVRWDSAPGRDPSATWLARTDLILPETTPVQFLASSNGTLRIALNGRLVYRRDEVHAFQPDADRFDATLATGANHLIVAVASAAQAAEFQLHFRRKSS